MEELLDRVELRGRLREALRGVQDLERLSGRIASRSASPRDLAAIKETLRALQEVRGQLEGCDGELLGRLRSRLQPVPEVVEMVERALVDEPPAHGPRRRFRARRFR